MLKISDIHKAYGSQTLFEGISFTVNPGEKIGLTGRNGHGKTTLIRMIIGEEHPDEGEISVPKGYRVGHVSQHLDFKGGSVIEEAVRGLQEHQKEQTWKAEKILSGLGFSTVDMERKPSEFSGGYQVRLNLAKVLVSEPDMLLLDEPTNYLDIVSIRWLTTFLRQWNSELVLVTHDRQFMDAVVTHIAGIHRKKMRKISGGTDRLYEQILREEEIHEKTRINDEKKRKESELFIRRFRAKARLAGLVQSRIKALEKQKTLDRLQKIETLDFSFSYRPFSAKTLMDISELTFSYGNETSPIIKGLSMNIRNGDRICVIGKNGRGKTTLLKLIAGALRPGSGSISSHGNTVTGYFEQTNTATLNPNATVEEEIMGTGCDRQTARNIAGAMMFEGDMALKRNSVLSGGEKNRVLLGKILSTPVNLLLLDAPHNHLDMESNDALLGAIDEFPGAAVIVTHNEMFLHSLASRFIVFQIGRITLFEGSYQDFLDRVGWEDEELPGEKTGAGEEARTAPSSKKDIRKLKADILTRRARELKPLEEKITAIESSIENFEKRITAINSEIIEASSQGRGGIIPGLSRELHAARAETDSLYGELEGLIDEHDARKNEFDRELEALNA